MRAGALEERPAHRKCGREKFRHYQNPGPIGRSQGIHSRLLSPLNLQSPFSASCWLNPTSNPQGMEANVMHRARQRRVDKEYRGANNNQPSRSVTPQVSGSPRHWPGHPGPRTEVSRCSGLGLDALTPPGNWQKPNCCSTVQKGGLHILGYGQRLRTT